MNALLRGSVATLVGSLALFAASTAFADGEACYVDKDCPGTACGDAVCNWGKLAPTANGMKIYYCNPAGTDAVGADGWCTTDADCKCMGEGAVCHAPYCSFTKAPAGSGGASSGGASSGGSAASTAGAPAAGASTAGASTAGASMAGAATSGSSDNGGGCSISAPGNTSSGAAAALALVGLGLVVARRRR